MRFVPDYFSAYKGKYFTGDGCRRDADGDPLDHRPGRRCHQRLR